MLTVDDVVGTGEMPLLEAALVVCLLGDLCLEEIKDDSLGQQLAGVVDNPNLFKWARAYTRVCGAHTKDLLALDITPLAPPQDLNDLNAAFSSRLNGEFDWRQRLQRVANQSQHPGVCALAEEGLHLAHPMQ